MVTAVVLTKNEEQNIERCLNALSFCNELIVVDDNSSDATLRKVQALGAKIFTHSLNNDFAAQRNFGLAQATSDWILFVDPDEEVTQALKNEILAVTSQSVPLSAFFIRRRDFFWKQELQFGETSQVRYEGLIRLVKKDSGSWTGKVHEVFQTTAQVGRLNEFLNHYPHPTVKDFLHDVNFYSSLRAQELYDSKKSTNVAELVGYPFGKFIYTFFLKKGFKDGAAGFAYAFFMSFHSFLVRAKLYMMKHK